MKKQAVFSRTAAGALGAAMLFAVAGAAVADEVGENSGGVDVHVEIKAVETGALTMSIANSEVSLVEQETDSDHRLFSGQLPEVVVSDTRILAPDSAGWYVLGQASAFVGGEDQDPISPEHFGWEPQLLTPDENGNVYAGWRIDTVMDAGPDNGGLQGEELLYQAYDSGEAREGAAEWRATAELFLKTPENVAPGQYSSLLTLSLFEEVL